MLKAVVYRHANEIAAYQRERLAKIDEEAQKMDFSAHLMKFAAEHRGWLNARKSMHDYEILQHKIRKTVPFKRSSATRYPSV
uniref:HSA domain-containing protein n=1 Tax=Ascaris lumbricoides TaxID=6252 RepID=A0A0M3HIW0_ASCLU